MNRLAAQAEKSTPLGLLIDDLAIHDASHEVIRSVQRQATSPTDLLRSRSDAAATQSKITPSAVVNVDMKPWSYVLGRLAGRLALTPAEPALESHVALTAQATGTDMQLAPIHRPWSCTLALLAGRPIAGLNEAAGATDGSGTAVPPRWRSMASRSPVMNVSELMAGFAWE